MRANEGDAYPLGALQIGTRVHCIEKTPGFPFHEIRAAGTYGTILRKFEGHVVVQNPEKHEIAYKETCMATVGMFILFLMYKLIPIIIDFIIFRTCFKYPSFKHTNRFSAKES